MPEFYTILVRKISKWQYSNFHNIFPKNSQFSGILRFLPPNARILHKNCPKNIIPDFFVGEAHALPAPVSYAYGCSWLMVEMNTGITDESACSECWRRLNGYENNNNFMFEDVRACSTVALIHRPVGRVDSPPYRPMNERRLRGWSGAYCSDNQVEWFWELRKRHEFVGCSIGL